MIKQLKLTNGEEIIGDVEEIKQVFVEFQQHLYNVKVA